MAGRNAHREPIAFLSYVHSDDEHEGGRLTQLRDRLSGEVRMQTGEVFAIFQDKKDIAWGQQWKERVENSIDAGTFLIPIITPGFFKSQPCRDELQRFLAREKQLDRQDLILPIYYMNCPILNDETRRTKDELAEIIAARQYADWRDLRHEPFTSPQVGKMITKLAEHIVEAVERGEAANPSVEPAAHPVHTERDVPETKAITAAAPGNAADIEGGVGGPVEKLEPRTLVVDALHRGDHSTVTAAINAAEPGDRILVRRGLYQEAIVIEKPVEIIGDGEIGDAVIQSRESNVIVFKSTMGRIVNLTLRQVGGGNCYGIDIVQGRLDLEGCDITSQSLACVAIHGGADPRLRRNRIHDGMQAGVYVYENGLGTLEDNDIFGNGFSG